MFDVCVDEKDLTAAFSHLVEDLDGDKGALLG
jgi:hypothetical protein